MSIELVPYAEEWTKVASTESERLRNLLGPIVRAVHHIGSTAIPGIAAKPVVDLIPVVSSVEELDERRLDIERLGYEWQGEYGLPGRRFCKLSDAKTGRRLVHLHCYGEGSPEIERHLAFRDFLRHRPGLAALYEQEKRRCRDAHPEDTDAYTDCKSRWIKAVEAEALRWKRGSKSQ
jgi:GrpB-like predicted nucleotidyltransferase (UPF0157 family)